MTETAIQLIVTVGICSLVGFTLFALICGEAQHHKQARSAAYSQSAPEMCSSVGKRSTPEARMALPDYTKQAYKIRHFKRTSRQHAEREELRQIGFSRTQIDRLITYRAAYRAGHYQRDFLLPGRLKFARWLYQQGKING